MSDELLFKVKGGEMLTVEELSDEDLEWYATECRPGRKRDAAQAERERRAGGGGSPPPREDRQPPPRQRRQAPPRAGIPADLTGGLSDPAAITDRLRKLSEHFNLISPATACSQVPPGCEVVTSFIIVDPTTDAKGNGPDVYKQKGGGFSLKGDTLSRIALAAGVRWILDECKRLDDGKNPRFAKHQTTGAWQDFDGSWVEMTRAKTIDLRDGSDQIPDEMSAAQLAGKRRTINEVVEAGSMNRVIRKLGVKSVYTAEELARPFAVVRLVFTGVTDDPDLKVPFAMLKAQQMTQGIGALYGRQQAPALGPAAAPPPQLGGRSRVTVDANGVAQDPPNDAPPDYDDGYGEEPTGTDDEPRY